MKVRDGVGKYLLKKAVAGLLPAEIVDRPKQGFGAPVSEWFREDLGERARREIRALVARRARPARLRRDRRALAGAPRRPRRLGLPALEHLQRERLARLLDRRARARGLRVGLRQGLALWRRAGTRAASARRAAVLGTRRGARGAAASAAAPRVGPAEVAAALGGVDPVAALRGPVLRGNADRRPRSRLRGSASGSLESRRCGPRAPLRPARLRARPTSGREIDWRRTSRPDARWPLRHELAAAPRRTATAPTSRCRGSSRASSTCRCSRPRHG